ncbi:MAG: hypothetical protein BGO49_23695 [Planctomycetales bacterium 71-10]|nr:MAG: hypothetical protein BGO49_23695 [Planctomycetales bacterium 71-10]
MDGAFACPECGQDVEVRSPGPGRQVRCSFCNTLIEVPFLPRVEGAWKRRRFGRPWWWAWAWWGVALSVIGLAAVAAAQAIVRGERAARARTIERLLDSSKSHEADGRIDLALMDLDTALQTATGDDDLPEKGEAIRVRRCDLARRDVQAVLGTLASDDRESGALGDWLNLVARAGADRDLAPVRRDVEARFAATLGRWLDDREARAGREPDPSTAFGVCVDAADLSIHLPPADHDAAVRRFRDIAARLVARRGTVLDVAPGTYVRGTKASYDKALHAFIVETLRVKGYLPPSPSRWADLWASAPYRFAYEIRETYEGSYLETQNRLTRIVATLMLSGPGVAAWKTAPSARTVVPVRGMPSYLASRLALSLDRVDEAERILYEDAFAQIRDKFRGGLANLPAYPAAATTSLGTR